ncbi:hypothetical protein MESS2_1230011 [Mesorhizobium metallidurans STM 2683]|uniref:Uncharacterized protein n=2 Tax=Mesorhizobium metallidurans TaxID=489722 RepID=M5EIY9_9HYPH|nr:hypothetical protein MESS2_1230011 [Mesorhizobium metallidurans STM 2683]
MIMPKYVVEEIHGNTVTASQSTVAPSPFKAAANATGRLMTLWSGEPACVRVTEFGMSRSFTYAYCGYF